MRMLIVSDIHGDAQALDRVLSMHRSADYLVFLGDGADAIEYLGFEYPGLTVKAVCGNCDRWSALPDELFFFAGGKKVFIAHGHTYYVKHSPESFIRHARQKGADIALFGHTHQPLSTYEDGMYIANPGSLRRANGGSYAIADITDAGIFIGISEL